MARDNFTKKTVDILAERVGFICSNPDCRVHTVGPNTNADKSTRVGEAAHIAAAAPGGPRYDPAMTAAQRSNINNGIWLCSNCSDLIDKDEAKYPTPLLHKWKADAENEMDKKIKGSNATNSTQPKFLPFLEADLIYSDSGRAPRGYSAKNKLEEHDGKQVIVAGSGLIMFWELDWNLSIALYNNSVFPAYNISITQEGGKIFNTISKLNKVNNLPAFANFNLQASYRSHLEGTHQEADKLILSKIPPDLDELIIKIEYYDDAREKHTTIATIKGQEIINTRE